MNLIYLALAQALEVYVIFFESLKGGIKNSPREVSSTNFPFDLPVHLHFNLVCSLAVLFATIMGSQMMTQMIDGYIFSCRFAELQKIYIEAKVARCFK